MTVQQGYESAERLMNAGIGSLLAIIDNMGVGVGISDDKGNILKLNKAALEIHGFETEAEMFSSFSRYAEEFELQYTNGTIMPIEEWPLSRAIRGEYVQNYEVKLIHKATQRTKYVDYNAVPVFDSENVRVNIVFNMVDISQFHEVNEALRESEQRFNNLFNNKTNGIAHCSILTNKNNVPVDFRFLQVNDAYTSITGLEKEQIIGRSARDVFPGIENYSFDYIGEMGKIALHGGELNFESYFEGLGRWFTVYAFRSKYGEFTIIFSDISERKRWEEQLKHKEAELAETQRIARIGSWSLNVNPESLEDIHDTMCIYAFDPISQSLSSNVEQSVIFYESKSWTQVNSFVQKALHTGESFELDVEATRSMKPIWVTMRGEAVKAKNGQITGLKGTIQDITERKIFERAVAKERELFQGIFNNIPVMITVYDPELKKFEFNQLFKSLTGYTEEDAQTGNLMNKLYPDPYYRSQVEEFMKSLQPGWKEFNLHTKDSGIVESSWANIQLSQGVSVGIGIDIRERKRAEASLKESEQRLRELADNISPLTWVADKNGEITWFSKRWFDYTGSTPDESLGWGWVKFHHPDHLNEVMDSFKKAIATGENWEKMFPLRAKDGNYRWYISRMFAIRDDNNNIIRWFGSNSDVHDQRMSEEKLRHNEQRLNAMFKNAGIGIVEVDTEERLLEVNDRFCLILGYEREELIGKKTDYDITYVEDLPRSILINKQLHESELKIFGYEKRYVKKDGSLVWVHVTISAVRSQDGKHVNSIGTVEDISERKKVEEALVESEKRFRLLADNISQMAWISKGDGTFIWFNKRWYDFTGVSLEEMLQGGHTKVNHPDHQERVYNNFIRCLENGERWEDTYPMIGKDGEYRWFLSTAMPIYDEAGGISLWFGTATDITAQIKTEEALRENDMRLRGIFDNAAIGIVEVDNNDNFIAVNERICKILGYSEEELLAKNVQEITAPEDRVHSEEMNAKLHRGELEVFDYEKRYLKKDGSTLWVHVSVSAIRDLKGAHKRTVRTIEDITERKNAQESILRSETILKQAGTMANLGAWDIELKDLDNLYCNPVHFSDETYRILGYEPGSIAVNLEFLVKQIHPEDRKRIIENWKLAFAEKKIFSLEHRIVRPDGSIRIVTENAEISFDSNKKPVRIIGAIQDVTEQKRAEQRLIKALAEAEEGKNILTALMEYIPLGITIAEAPHLRIRMESRYGEKLIESADMQVAEMPLSKQKFEEGFYHTDTLEKALPHEIPLTRATQKGEIVKNEEWLVSRNDGTLIPILCNAAPILDKNENLIGGIIAWQDITERRRMIQELKKSEENLRLVIDSAQLGTWNFDIETGIAEHSLRHDQIFGYTELQKEWSYEISVKHILPEYHSTVREAVAQAIETGELYYEAKIRWPDESLHWIAPRGKVYYNEKGKPLRMVGIVSDITSRKMAEEALKESEEKFRSLFESITEGVAIHEMLYIKNKPVNYRFLNVNPAFKEYFNIKSDVPVGILASELFNTCDLPYLNEFSKVAKTRQPYRFEAYFPDINKHFIINVISPQNGQFATVYEDISEQKKIEQEMKQRNEELTRFIYTVSHDLKSPLVTIKSFTSYLKEDISVQDKEAQDKDIGYIENAADKMGKLLDELLELSRIGRKEDTKSEVHLDEIVQTAIDLVAGQISQKNANVFITAPPLVMTGYSQRLIQLFQNLIDNAVKFSGKQAEPKVEIGAYKDPAKNNQWVLFVRDNGIGIDPRYHHKIFGLFEKLDNTAEGTGIGLALIKRIIEVHEGSIWFQSEGTGKGTTFYFTLKGIKESYKMR